MEINNDVKISDVSNFMTFEPMVTIHSQASQKYEVTHYRLHIFSFHLD